MAANPREAELCVRGGRIARARIVSCRSQGGFRLVLYIQPPRGWLTVQTLERVFRTVEEAEAAASGDYGVARIELGIEGEPG